MTMHSDSSLTVTSSLFRIDKFIVPPAAMAPFLARVQHVKDLLDTVPGCKQNLMLTQNGGPGEYNVVTIVEWENADAVSHAQAFMKQRYAEEAFDPAAYMISLGVRADLGMYADASVQMV